MKRLFTILMIALLSLSLAACEKKEPVETIEEPDDTISEPVENNEPSEPTDDDLLKEIKAELVGLWKCNGWEELEQLTFNDDYTGHYEGLDKSYDFTYSIVVDRLDTPNNGRDIEYVMTVSYDTGDTEDIRFITGDRGISGPEGVTKMLFQSIEHGGYSGMINNLDVWVKQ